MSAPDTPHHDGTLATHSVLDHVRSACATVAERATHVHIDPGALEHLASTLNTTLPQLLPEERPAGDDADVVAKVLAWNAVNFGSGWFPHLNKRPGLSGARSLAAAFADHVDRAGPPTAEWLMDVDAALCATIFDQPHPGPVDDLLDLFATAWRDLGKLLALEARGSAAALVQAASGSADHLVGTLASMPLAHDVVQHGDIEVPLLKRAQITVSHLSRALNGHGLGDFHDIDRLTAFADNLVPHVLRMTGVLVYDDHLVAHIDHHDLLEPGSIEEVEIRACGLHAVELLAERTGVPPSVIDHQLWQRGQDPVMKAVPRHRCRCSWY